MKMHKKIPLVHAVAWIVGSAVIVSGTAYSGLKAYLRYHYQRNCDPEGWISAIVQTGPQKEALKIDYLAELMEISGDRPVQLSRFDLSRAEKKLLGSPVIKQASVKPLPPSTLYVDYAVRSPVAWLCEYDNIAVDEEKYTFPVYPFFTPKNLPEIYIGLSPAFAPASGPLEDARLELALSLLKLLQQTGSDELVHLKRIDVANAFSESYGLREIVLICEDPAEEGVHKRFLRLSTKNYAQELGNYLKLREGFAEMEKGVPASQKVVDLRLSKIAFIE